MKIIFSQHLYENESKRQIKKSDGKKQLAVHENILCSKEQSLNNLNFIFSSFVIYIFELSLQRVIWRRLLQLPHSMST